VTLFTNRIDTQNLCSKSRKIVRIGLQAVPIHQKLQKVITAWLIVSVYFHYLKVNMVIIILLN